MLFKPASIQYMYLTGAWASELSVDIVEFRDPITRGDIPAALMQCWVMAYVSEPDKDWGGKWNAMPKEEKHNKVIPAEYHEGD